MFSAGPVKVALPLGDTRSGMTYVPRFVNLLAFLRSKVGVFVTVSLFVGCAGDDAESFDDAPLSPGNGNLAADAGGAIPPSRPGPEPDGSTSIPVVPSPDASVVLDAAVSPSGDTDASSTSSSDGGNSGASTDAADPLTGILDGLGSLLGDGGSAPSSSGGGGASSADGGMCANAICIDVFDCYLFHPDLVDCGFTACDGFVCK